jgi:hypothetical protein
MSVITAEEMVNFVIKAKNEGWGYVYSGQGELYTPALAQQWGNENRAGRSYDYYVNQCSRWFNRTVADCSGLVIQAFRSKKPNYTDQTANTLLANSMPKGALSTIPEQPGICVWRNGHIGIYIGSGNVIESGGTSVGVVQTRLKSPATNKAWTHWGNLADVDYSKAPVTSPSAQTGGTTGNGTLYVNPNEAQLSSFKLGRLLKIANPYMRGSDVRDVQYALDLHSFSPGIMDGVYGNKTRSAVVLFQENNRLTADGIVGRQTASKLGGIWTGN